MVLDADDFEYRYSGGTSNTSGNASLGGAMSTVSATATPPGIITTPNLHNLFDKINGDEALAGDTSYRCIYVRNIGGQNAERVRIYISQNPNSQIAIGLDPAANGSNTATTLDNEYGDTGDTGVGNNHSPPSGVTFTQPITAATALSIGELTSSSQGSGQQRAVWIRRTIGANAAVDDAADAQLTLLADSGE